MKKPAIVLIITKLELGGAQKVCLALYTELKKRGYAVYLISGNDGILASHVRNDPNVFLLPTLVREVGIKTVISECKTAWQIVRILRMLKKKHPDVIVHTHSTKAGIVGRWMAFFAGIKKRVHTIHGFAFHQFQPWPRWLIIYSVELLTSIITKRFICVSSYDQTYGERLFPFFTKKQTLIRAAVDHTLFVPARRNCQALPDPFIFGTVACFKPQKNLFDLLRAFAIVHNAVPHARLEILGDGILRPAIERWMQQHSLGDAITLHGWQNTIAPYMAQWHVFALSSLWEGLPCAIIEARFMKLPVIAYNVGGIQDVIKNEHNGQLVSPGDYKELANRMLTIATDAKRYHAYQNAPDALEEFTYASMVTRHCIEYAQLD